MTFLSFILKPKKITITFDCHMCHDRHSVTIDSKGAGSVVLAGCPHCGCVTKVTSIKNGKKWEAVTDFKNGYFFKTNSEHRLIKDFPNWVETIT